VGAEVWEEAIPRAQFRGGEVDLRFALHGGDAYELLFTAGKQIRVPTRIDGLTVTEIGVVTRTKKLVIVDAAQTRSVLRPQGWEHFRQAPASK
jgi:thiamine-monophosphate kinase